MADPGDGQPCHSPKLMHLGKWYKIYFLSGSNGVRIEAEAWATTSSPGPVLPQSATVQGGGGDIENYLLCFGYVCLSGYETHQKNQIKTKFHLFDIPSPKGLASVA